jgi:hypothetical protein
MSKASKNTISPAYNILFQYKYILIGITEVLAQISLLTSFEIFSDIKLKFINKMWSKYVVDLVRNGSISDFHYFLAINAFISLEHKGFISTIEMRES